MSIYHFFYFQYTMSTTAFTSIFSHVVSFGYTLFHDNERLDKCTRAMHNACMTSIEETQRIFDVHSSVCFVRSYAKINLTLDVLGKGADGYHDLASIMQAVDLYDTLCLSPIPEDAVRIVCTRPELENESNLAFRAAQLVRQRLSLRRGVEIALDKHIPVAAGLGGGSSNAAAVLLALRQWWQLPLSSEELLELAAMLGSDVPFFLSDGLALCEGRGERVTPLLPYWPASMRWLLLLKPAIEVSTATVFRRLAPADYTSGVHTQAVHRVLQTRGEPSLEDIHNSLERGVLDFYPEVAHAQADMLRAGASLVRLSGSGPTLFAPFAGLQRATQVRDILHSQGYEVYLTRAVYPNAGNITTV
jgi:4-diphosphocytidyl-2-C-methyl-D-erythritol kinase